MPFDNVDERAVVEGNVFYNLHSHGFKGRCQHTRKVIGKPVAEPFEVRVPCFGVVGNEGCGHRRVDGKALKESRKTLAQDAVGSLRSNERVGQREGRLWIHQLFDSAQGGRFNGRLGLQKPSLQFALAVVGEAKGVAPH